MIPVPRHVCPVCGEYLPHACAPIVTIKRAKWQGRRVITIQDRESVLAPETVSAA